MINNTLEEKDIEELALHADERVRALVDIYKSIMQRPYIFVLSGDARGPITVNNAQGFVLDAVANAVTVTHLQVNNPTTPVSDDLKVADSILAVNYLSQWDPTAKDHYNDCGPTCVAMLLATFGGDISVDQIYQKDLPYVVGDLYTSVGDLINIAANHDLVLERSIFTLEKLRQTLKEGYPVIALVNYNHIGIGNFAHFFVVVGYDDEFVYVHDPYAGFDVPRSWGRYRPVRWDSFEGAWTGNAVQGNLNYLGLTCKRSVPHELKNVVDTSHEVIVQNPKWAGGLNARTAKNIEKVSRTIPNGDKVTIFELLPRYSADYPYRARISPIVNDDYEHVAYYIQGALTLT